MVVEQSVPTIKCQMLPSPKHADVGNDGLSKGQVQMQMRPLTAPPMQSVPSFRSVFGANMDMDGINEDKTTLHIPSCSRTAHSVLHNPQVDSLPPSHRGSESSMNSESTDSSPTTTISTIDSASITDPSPSSSPDSPVGIVSLSAFKNMAMEEHAQMSMNHSTTAATTDNANMLKKTRNTKKLCLNLAPLTPGGIASQRLTPLSVKTSSVIENQRPKTLSEFPSPSFIIPPKPMRRRSKVGLTIKTPAYHTTTFATSGSLVPPTPSIAKTNLLHHAQSSPSLFSPSMGPAGGMQLPSVAEGDMHADSPKPLLSQQKQSSSFVSDARSMRSQSMQEDELYYEPPLSAEPKSPTYPHGPVCIYEPNVYLYFEPTAPEASEFDVVINVAREVENPFMRDPRQPPSPTLQLRRQGETSHHAEPKTAISTASFAMALENVPTILAQPPTPATPKSSNPPCAATATKTPEYIHYPWEHNSDIVDDMLSLCSTIEDRAVRQGRRVLVHCQCGVSRSATLTVAYGLYRNPRLSVQEAYDNVKEKSRWIGPNMSLIYQLSEFRTKVRERMGIKDDQPATPALFSPRAATFTKNPFHEFSTVVGDLVAASPGQYDNNILDASVDPLSPGAVVEEDRDPRSPPHLGEAPITRSLFGVLESDYPSFSPTERTRTVSSQRDGRATTAFDAFVKNWRR